MEYSVVKCSVFYKNKIFLKNWKPVKYTKFITVQKQLHFFLIQSTSAVAERKRSKYTTTDSTNKKRPKLESNDLNKEDPTTSKYKKSNTIKRNTNPLVHCCQFKVFAVKSDVFGMPITEKNSF